MSVEQIAAVASLLSAGPEFSGEFGADTIALARFAEATEARLAELPTRVRRDSDEQELADALIATGRDARRRFLDRHVIAVYDTLTTNGTVHLRLSELVQAAAGHFPGLVRDHETITREQGRRQADKDGHEVDQAIFISAVLRSPATGRHLMDAMRRPSPLGLEMLEQFQRTGRLALETLSVVRHGRAAHVEITNMHCLNAEDEKLVTELEAAVDSVSLDPQVGVGVVRGGVMNHPRYRGKRVFSAGINLSDLRNGEISLVHFLLGRELGALNKLVHGVLIAPESVDPTARSVQKPWVAGVESFAIGGGMQLMLLFDHVVAAQDAYFSLPAAQEGIIPGVANHRLTRQVGSRLARRIILSGRRIRATDPEALYLCDEVVPPEDVDEALLRAAAALDSPAVVANRRMLNLAEEPLDQLREYLAEFALVQAERVHSADVLDKLEKRWSAQNR